MSEQIQLTALRPELLIRLLQQSGSRLATLEQLERDFVAGAPRNADGTVNLVSFSAWLMLQRKEDSND